MTNMLGGRKEGGRDSSIVQHRVTLKEDCKAHNDSQLPTLYNTFSFDMKVTFRNELLLW